MPQTTENTNKTKQQFFENIHTIDKPSEMPMKKKEKNHQIQ